MNFFDCMNFSIIIIMINFENCLIWNDIFLEMILDLNGSICV